MSSLNKLQLIGRLGHDPSGKVLPSGDMVVNVSLATSEQWKDKAGVKQERTTWFALSFWGKLAEIAEQYLRKGSLVYVEGSVGVRPYMNKQNEPAAALEVRVREMKMLSSKASTEDGSQAQMPAAQSVPATRRAPTRAPEPVAVNPVDEEFDDDIPF